MNRHAYPLMPWLAWLTGTRTSPLAETFTQSTKACLISIAKAFQATNFTIKQQACRAKEVSDRYAEYYVTHPTISPNKKLRWYFAGGDLETSDLLINRIIPGESRDPSDLIEYLEDETCLRIWRAGLDSLIVYLRRERHEWNLTKQLALDILTQRDIAAKSLDRLEFMQRTAEVEKLCDSFREKLSLMERFTTFYNAQPPRDSNGDQPPPEPYYNLYRLGEQNEKRIYGPVLITAVTLTTLACTLPLALAWQNSTERQGSNKDAELYLLIVNSVMSILGIFTAIFPFGRKQTSAYNRWARWLSLLGVLGVIAAPPMYCYLPMMWSALVASLAQAVQSVATLQLALAVEES